MGHRNLHTVVALTGVDIKFLKRVALDAAVVAAQFQLVAEGPLKAIFSKMVQVAHEHHWDY